jgi:hypothetical protein
MFEEVSDSDLSEHKGNVQPCYDVELPASICSSLQTVRYASPFKNRDIEVKIDPESEESNRLSRRQYGTVN